MSIKDAHDRQYNYMKITIFILIRMIRLIGFWGSYSLSFICGHIGLCAFTFILVDQFCIMFYPCPSVSPSVMFWFPFNNLSLPWTWSNVLKFGCVKNHKRPVNFDFYKSRGIYGMSHVHLLFFILLYFLLVKYRIRIHV